MCFKIKLTLLRYGNTLRWSIEVNIPVATKPFWSWNIVQRNRLNSSLLVFDFALYYYLTVNFVVGVFKVLVKIALHIVYFEHPQLLLPIHLFVGFIAFWHIHQPKYKIQNLRHNKHLKKINLSTIKCAPK